MIVDLTGMAIREILAFPAVTAIVGQKVRGEWALNETPPGVIVESLGIDYNPGGGTRRLGLQEPTYAAKCYHPTRTGCSQLANAVVEAINLRGPRKDSSGRLIWLSLVDSGGDVVLDPVRKWPFATVHFRLLGAQQAAVVA